MLYGAKSVPTDEHLLELVTVAKCIVSKTPRHGYAEEGHHRRCQLELRSDHQDGTHFVVFIRQNTQYSENFSIGLRCRVGTTSLGMVTLIRYNGPHGETSLSADGHYAVPHVHRLTSAELALGSAQPRERERERTTRYGIFEEAVSVFLGDIGVTNSLEFFPALGQLRLPL